MNTHIHACVHAVSDMPRLAVVVDEGEVASLLMKVLYTMLQLHDSQLCTHVCMYVCMCVHRHALHRLCTPAQCRCLTKHLHSLPSVQLQPPPQDVQVLPAAAAAAAAAAVAAYAAGVASAVLANAEYFGYCAPDPVRKHIASL
jgi:hypothetical protein